MKLIFFKLVKFSYPLVYAVSERSNSEFVHNFIAWLMLTCQHYRAVWTLHQGAFRRGRTAVGGEIRPEQSSWVSESCLASMWSCSRMSMGLERNMAKRQVDGSYPDLDWGVPPSFWNAYLSMNIVQLFLPFFLHYKTLHNIYNALFFR